MFALVMREVMKVGGFLRGGFGRDAPKYVCSSSSFLTTWSSSLLINGARFSVYSFKPSLISSMLYAEERISVVSFSLLSKYRSKFQKALKNWTFLKKHVNIFFQKL